MIFTLYSLYIDHFCTSTTNVTTSTTLMD